MLSVAYQLFTTMKFRHAALSLLALSLNCMSAGTTTVSGAYRVPADSTGNSWCKPHMQMPLELTAHDFITRVYGFADNKGDKAHIVAESKQHAGVEPTADEFGLWMNPENGYSISYYGMCPYVEALATFDDDTLSSYGFFFIFPYSAGERDNANHEQSRFCGSLLQEIYDIGVRMAVTDLTDALFHTIGYTDGNCLDIRLIEEVASPDGSEYSDKMSASCEMAAVTPDSHGRFVVILNVEPDAETEADELVALAP